jgi:hypothetical protein
MACHQNTQTRRAPVDSSYLCVHSVPFHGPSSSLSTTRPDRREGRGAEGQGRGAQYLGCCARASFEGSIPLLVGGARLLSSRLRWEPALWQRQRGDGAVRWRHRPICPPVPLNPARGGSRLSAALLACFPTRVSRSGVVPAAYVRYFNNNNQPTDQPTSQPTCNRRPSRCLSQPLQSLSLSHATVTQQRPCRWYSRAPPERVRAGRSGRIDRSIESSRMPDKPEPGSGSWDFDAAWLSEDSSFEIQFRQGGLLLLTARNVGRESPRQRRSSAWRRGTGCGGSGQHEHWTWRPVGMRGGERQQREQTKESSGELSISYRRMHVMPTASSQG